MGCFNVNTMEKSIQYHKKLNNGLKCPIIGLGTDLIRSEEDVNVVY